MMKVLLPFKEYVGFVRNTIKDYLYAQMWERMENDNNHFSGYASNMNCNGENKPSVFEKTPSKKGKTENV